MSVVGVGVPSAPVPGRVPTAARVAVRAGWPAGLVLLLAAVGGGMPVTVTILVAVVFALAAGLAVRAAGGRADPDAAAILGAGLGLFALLLPVGPPSAGRPIRLALNTGVLLVVALVLLVVAVRLAVAVGPGRGRALAASAACALVVGTTGYLLNLLARWAVLLSGAAPAQVAVEDTAWQAHAYLTGLDGEPGYLAFLLVWLDLAQLAYVVLTHLAFGALALSLAHDGALPSTSARRIAVAAAVLSGAVVVGAIAAALPVGPVAAVGAWTAFVLTVPLTTTLLPYGLGVALLLRPRAFGGGAGCGHGPVGGAA